MIRRQFSRTNKVVYTYVRLGRAEAAQYTKRWVNIHVEAVIMVKIERSTVLRLVHWQLDSKSVLVTVAPLTVNVFTAILLTLSLVDIQCSFGRSTSYLGRRHVLWFLNGIKERSGMIDVRVRRNQVAVERWDPTPNGIKFRIVWKRTEHLL